MNQLSKVMGTCFVTYYLIFPLAVHAEDRSLPIIYEVIGVGESDVLNVRAGPSGRSRDLGDLLPGQQVEVTAFSDNGNWGQILWEEKEAWVSTRFLQVAELFGDDFSGMPLNLSCAGTEPFWSVRISPGAQFGFSEVESEVAWSFIETSVMSSNTHRSNYAFNTSRFTGFLRRAECSDGKPDLNYSWALDLLEKGENARLWSGCCSIILPVVDGY